MSGSPSVLCQRASRYPRHGGPHANAQGCLPRKRARKVPLVDWSCGPRAWLLPQARHGSASLSPEPVSTGCGTGQSAQPMPHPPLADPALSVGSVICQWGATCDVYLGYAPRSFPGVYLRPGHVISPVGIARPMPVLVAGLVVCFRFGSKGRTSSIERLISRPGCRAAARAVCR